MSAGTDTGLSPENLARSMNAIDLHHEQSCYNTIELKGYRLVLKKSAEGKRYLDFCKPTIKQMAQSIFGRGNASLTNIASFCNEHHIVSGTLIEAVEKFQQEHPLLSKRLPSDCVANLQETLQTEHTALEDVVKLMKNEQKEPFVDNQDTVLKLALDCLKIREKGAEPIAETLYGITAECAVKCAEDQKYLPIAKALYRGGPAQNHAKIVCELLKDGKEVAAFNLMVSSRSNLSGKEILERAANGESEYYDMIKSLLGEVGEWGSRKKEGRHNGDRFIEFFIESGHSQVAEKLLSTMEPLAVQQIINSAIYNHSLVVLKCAHSSDQLRQGLSEADQGSLEELIDKAAGDSNYAKLVEDICKCRADVQPFSDACKNASTSEELEGIQRRIETNRQLIDKDHMKADELEELIDRADLESYDVLVKVICGFREDVKSFSKACEDAKLPADFDALASRFTKNSRPLRQRELEDLVDKATVVGKEEVFVKAVHKAGKAVTTFSDACKNANSRDSFYDIQRRIETNRQLIDKDHMKADELEELIDRADLGGYATLVKVICEFQKDVKSFSKACEDAKLPADFDALASRFTKKPGLLRQRELEDLVDKATVAGKEEAFVKAVREAGKTVTTFSEAFKDAKGWSEFYDIWKRIEKNHQLIARTKADELEELVDRTDYVELAKEICGVRTDVKSFTDACKDALENPSKEKFSNIERRLLKSKQLVREISARALPELIDKATVVGCESLVKYICENRKNEVDSFCDVCKYGMSDAVKDRLEKTPDIINVTDKDGHTVLHFACLREDNEQVISILLEKRRDLLWMRDRGGNLPLHGTAFIIADGGRWDNLIPLLDRPAGLELGSPYKLPLNEKNNQGETVLDILPENEKGAISYVTQKGEFCWPRHVAKYQDLLWKEGWQPLNLSGVEPLGRLREAKKQLDDKGFNKYSPGPFQAIIARDALGAIFPERLNIKDVAKSAKALQLRLHADRGVSPEDADLGTFLSGLMDLQTSCTFVDDDGKPLQTVRWGAQAAPKSPPPSTPSEPSEFLRL